MPTGSSAADAMPETPQKKFSFAEQNLANCFLQELSAKKLPAPASRAISEALGRAARKTGSTFRAMKAVAPFGIASRKLWMGKSLSSKRRPSGLTYSRDFIDAKMSGMYWAGSWTIFC